LGDRDLLLEMAALAACDAQHSALGMAGHADCDQHEREAAALQNGNGIHSFLFLFFASVHVPV
jgi:hypothetical protein